MFEKQNIRIFLAEIGFGFSVSADNLITDVQLGVTETGRLTPKSKMFIYPFSNVEEFRLCTEVTCCRQLNHCISLTVCHTLY